MTTWVSPFSPFRNQVDADIRALVTAVRRTEARIATGDKRGRALAAVAGRFGVVAAARLHHATDVRWRVAVAGAGGGPGAGRYVEGAVNRMIEDNERTRLTAA